MNSLISMGSLFFSDTEKNFSEKYNNIFVPVEDKPENGKTQETKRTVKLSDIEFPGYGDQFGELIIADCQINAKLFFGDNDIALNNGVGIYNGSSIPGYGKTILVAGHNNTYLNGLKYAQKGQEILVRTSYGNFKYEITDVQIKDYKDKSAYDLAADGESLILYTCYPFDELGLTPQRCFVYAKPLPTNIVIDKNN
ncbi:MAG: class D sortase [Acutalibacteraceae bacterium]